METYDIRNTQRQRAATGTEKWISTSPRMLVSVSYTHLDVYKRQV